MNSEILAATLVKASAGGYVYLASPYSKLVKTVGLDEAARVVAVAAGSLIAEGVVVFSPIAHGHFVAESAGLDKLDADMWMKQCYPLLKPAKVCAVLMFAGWKDSSGVNAEIEFAKSNGISVAYIEPEWIVPAHILDSLA